MKVTVSTPLEIPAAQVYAHVLTPALLRHVAAPLVIFSSREPGGFPQRWSEGPHRVWMWGFGVLPLGPQTVGIEFGPDDEAAGVYRVRDNGSGLLAKVWDHRITIRAEGLARTHYTDDVEVRAGLLTPIVWAFASVFYRWRQMRWRALVRTGFAALG